MRGNGRYTERSAIVKFPELGLSMLHPQLAADCHLLLEWPQCQVLLNRNALVPWFILVPRTEVVDLLDLPAKQREAVLDEAARISRFIREKWDLQKINIAQLGNVVPQMHLHVIGRSTMDDCWPRPVWGNLSDQKEYPDEEVRQIARQLSEFDR